MTPPDILANADRLLADARFLCDAGRCRSAATLIAVALEQLGQFVDAITKEKYPDAVTEIGLFKNKTAHARRQDVLAAHVFNYAYIQAIVPAAYEVFVERTGCCDTERFANWIQRASPHISFTVKQQDRINNDPDVRTGIRLMNAVREKTLQHLREYGLYENTEVRFLDEAVGEALELAMSVRAILEKSQDVLVPTSMGLPGVNMPASSVDTSL